MRNSMQIRLSIKLLLCFCVAVAISSCSVNKKLYKKTIAEIKDSTGFVFHPTPSMDPVKKPANYVETDFGFELWYESTNVDADVIELTQDLKNQSKRLSTNTDLPIFWSTSYGNNWDHLGRWGRENMSEWHLSLPNSEADAKANGGSVSDKGQVWRVSVMPYDHYIRAFFQLDCIKSGDRYYQYDLGDNDVYIHK